MALNHHCFPTTLALAALLAWAPAYAQSPAPAAAPSTDLKTECGPKPEYPGKLGSEFQRKAWTKNANVYMECLKKAVTARQEVAQQYMKAANEAIDQYNATIKEFEAASKGE